MIQAAKDVAKAIAVRSGALNLYHKFAHQDALTVLMFHRVLTEEEFVRRKADPTYTIATTQFREFLKSLLPLYNFVSTRDLEASLDRRKPLPARPMLITFDDGWRDNFERALPELAALNIPWTIFVATSVLDSPPQWWQETLLVLLRTGAVSYEELWNLAAEAPSAGKSDGEPTLALLLRYGALTETQRQTVLTPFARRIHDGERDMVSVAELRAIHRLNVDIGLHGASHLPLTAASDPRKEINDARGVLMDALGAAPLSMSFPHGRYNDLLLQEARDAGLKLLFTSDPILNPCPGGYLLSDVIGRIPVSGKGIADEKGSVAAERWMPRLYLRARRKQSA